jgi:hypothetical protein
MTDPDARERKRVPRARFPDRRQWERARPTDPVAGGKPVRPPQPGEWSEQIAEWLDRREREHPPNQDDRTRRPRPYLDIAATFAPQISASQVGEDSTVTVRVWNAGNVPAWSCYVEVYEGPGGFATPLADHIPRGQAIITLHPGEQREITLPWRRDARTGRIVAIIFDPILDPKGFTVVPQTDRHLASVSYVDLD